MPYEYAPYGKTILRREEGSTADWEDVPPDDIEEATAAVKEAAAQRKVNLVDYKKRHEGRGGVSASG